MHVHKFFVMIILIIKSLYEIHAHFNVNSLEKLIPPTITLQYMHLSEA